MVQPFLGAGVINAGVVVGCVNCMSDPDAGGGFRNSAGVGVRTGSSSSYFAVFIKPFFRLFEKDLNLNASLTPWISSLAFTCSKNLMMSSRFISRGGLRVTFRGMYFSSMNCR